MRNEIYCYIALLLVPTIGFGYTLYMASTVNNLVKKIILTIFAFAFVGFGFWATNANAQEINESLLYKQMAETNLMYQHQLQQQQLMQQQIQQIQQAKIAALKAKLQQQAQQPQVAIAQPLPPLPPVNPGSYAGSVNSLKQNQIATPPSVQESLTPNEEQVDELTPQQAEQERTEQEQSTSSAPAYSDGDPLGLKSRYVVRGAGPMVRVVYQPQSTYQPRWVQYNGRVFDANKYYVQPSGVIYPRLRQVQYVR
jgi:hypothetical protein